MTGVTGYLIIGNRLPTREMASGCWRNACVTGYLILGNWLPTRRLGFYGILGGVRAVVTGYTALVNWLPT